jgi:hypothetical protein
VGEFYRRASCEVVLRGGGVVVMEQVPHDSRRDKGKGDSVAGDDGGGCAAKRGYGWR